MAKTVGGSRVRLQSREAKTEAENQIQPFCSNLSALNPWVRNQDELNILIDNEKGLDEIIATHVKETAPDVYALTSIPLDKKLGLLEIDASRLKRAFLSIHMSQLFGDLKWNKTKGIHLPEKVRKDYVEANSYNELSANQSRVYRMIERSCQQLNDDTKKLREDGITLSLANLFKVDHEGMVSVNTHTLISLLRW